MSHDGPMSLADHLRELRRCLLWSLAAVGIGTVVAFAFTDALVAWLRRPLHADLIFLSPAEAFWTDMKVAVFAGLFLVLPVVLYQIWRFIMPGLLSAERRHLLPFLTLSYLSFVLGDRKSVV